MRILRLAASLIAATALATAPAVSAAGVAPEAVSSRHSYDLGIAPRLQWNANYGYCGEVSFISAGMYYGQYTSQWTARSLASPGTPQTEEESQLLIGVNDVEAAERMRLQAVPFDSESQQSTRSYLTWVKSMALRGYPVIIGVFVNMSEFEDGSVGSSEYDHIVPVTGIRSRSPLSVADRRYRPTDVIAFSDNGVDGSAAPSDAMFRYRFDAFQRSRGQANDPQAPAYSLLNRPMDYATAVTGVRDLDGVTIPVRLTSSADGEGAQDGDRLEAPPAPRAIDLTATVTIPDPSLGYNVYLYDDFAKVPVSNFNASSANALQAWTIAPGTATTWSRTISTMSDQTRVFRAVPTSAP
ncbi:MAG: hypothetical protein F2793_08045 [Actinobacteria bacterium]|nr:hypothetical protein [Actinomycetota bacterium]